MSGYEYSRLKAGFEVRGFAAMCVRTNADSFIGQIPWNRNASKSYTANESEVIVLTKLLSLPDASHLEAIHS